MRRRLGCARSGLALGCIAIALLLQPSAAAGGGWWTSIRLDRTTVAVGQEVKAHANVMFSSIEAIEAAQGAEQPTEFYVYLLRGLDYSGVQRAMRKPAPQNWWSVSTAEAIRVGRVAIGGSESNLATATASFRVPDLPAGAYAVMFCDAGCVHPLADVIPTFPGQFTVVADPATARLASRVQGLEKLMVRRTGEISFSRATASKAQAAAAMAQARTRRLEARLRALERDVESAKEPLWADGPWLVVGALLGALLTVALRRRRAARLQPTWQPSDDELAELLSSEPRRSHF